MNPHLSDPKAVYVIALLASRTSVEVLEWKGHWEHSPLPVPLGRRRAGLEVRALVGAALMSGPLACVGPPAVALPHGGCWFLPPYVLEVVLLSSLSRFAASRLLLSPIL